MEWFAFGFNGFGQLIANNAKCAGGQSTRDVVKVTVPINVSCGTFQHKAATANTAEERRRENTRVRASWSRTLTLHAEGEGCQVCVSGFGAGAPHRGWESRACTDARIGEAHLTLAFTDRVECWDLGLDEEEPAWSMDIKTPDEAAGGPPAFPLVPGGYIASKPPFYRSLSPLLRAASLALGAEHALLLTASGAVYTWGSGSHGQLGHGDLGGQEEPRVVEALWGLPVGGVAAGGWHSACLSAGGGDLYVWGWNESGQLGLPSRALRGSQRKSRVPTDAGSSLRVQNQEAESGEEVFISIQAFPALLDVSPPCEVTAGSQPCEVTAGSQPCEVTAGSQPCEVTAGSPPCEVTTGSQPCEVTAGSQPCEVTAGSQPCEVTAGSQPCEVTAGSQPCEVTAGSQPCEVTALSCGSRHTAAVTDTGDLYTWGWGEYGQLGHGTTKSSDEPGRVDFFKDQGLCVVDVECGAWNTFVCCQRGT